MANKRCREIKNLEKRLVCLKDKHDQLTKQLEESRNSSSSDAGLIDYQQLIEERRIVEKYMNRLTKRIISHEKSISTSEVPDSSNITTGNIVEIVNSNSQLKFILVDEISTTQENQISVKSPIGQEVLGRRVGDDIFVETPEGKIHYQIKSVE